jgi:hypothetical protein
MSADAIFSLKIQRGTDSAPVIGEGWWDLEPERIWAKGTRSTLSLPPLCAGDSNLELHISAFIHPEIRPVQRLVVRCNGVEVGSFKFRHPKAELVVFRLPAGILEGGAENTIDLYHPDHLVPMEVDAANGDWRDLSICLMALSVRPAMKPSAQAASVNIFGDMESLGEGCEFGFVQRLAGVEALGLLRFSGITLPDLIRALDARFDNIGSPENIRIEPKSGVKEMYVFEDSYRLNYHFFQDGAEVDLLKEIKRQSARIRFLARNLMENLEGAEKLFVWCSHKETAESDVLKLVETMQSYGPNTLLWVSSDPLGSRVGQVSYVTKGLMRGHIDRIAPPPASIGAISFDAWKVVGAAAHKLWKERRAG